MPEAMGSTIRIMEAKNRPDCVMTRFVAPSEPVGRWRRYMDAYRHINEDPYLAELAPAMRPYAEKVPVAEKSTYSAVDAPEVRAALAGKSAVVLTGVVADCCVLATMMDAIDLGYEVVYLYDCIGGMTAESEEQCKALAEVYAPVHTTVMTSEEYLAAIGAE